MDLRRDFLFSVIIWVVIQRDFILCGQAGFNDGPIILNSTDTLEINTTAPSIEIRYCDSCNFNASSYETRDSSCVANVTFSGDIEFKKGSRINVTGKCALSITSQNGNITIKSDINMTCDKELFNATCLGGFTQLSQPIYVGHQNQKLYKGDGPGSLKILKYNAPLSGSCLLGSTHGGKAPQSTSEFEVGEAYGIEDLTTFQGGSGGHTASYCETCTLCKTETERKLASTNIFVTLKKRCKTNCAPFQPLQSLHQHQNKLPASWEHIKQH